jgi:hypothetical protein
MTYTHNGMEGAKGITGVAGGPGPLGAPGQPREGMRGITGESGPPGTYWTKELADSLKEPKATVTYPDYKKIMDHQYPGVSPLIGPGTMNPLEFGFKSDDAVENLPKDAVEREIVGACNALARTLIMKRRDYGPHNFRRFGVLGILVRLDDKISRLNNLLSGDKLPQNESTDDSWLDAAGYSIIGYLFNKGKW